ncbi:3-oxo-5-alpha-steroid 4-dehydrogenase [Sinobacterium norvegicum]|uniref:3-oxo-5-alpha-steroid 4-dehydrogenase n=1 Tax=Sinobacterium norvegicum TaxID=1641715 RepID=A0ABM9ACV1_9GAMM|nr:FAD-binding protein [Sinobacterium norvegicum]CAH0990509.1 3-oxo-5-alpha-steroid 4-dehydrogenase [Sinobacterium norvegicum]
MPSPNDKNWFSHVAEPLIVDNVDDCVWDRSADVVIVGFGGAGASAAIEAVEQGADVIAIDRFKGGGATQISGGIFYCGGGSEFQQQANFEDSAEEMFKYLQMEVQGVVSDKTLQRFCETSLDNLSWLQGNGVKFEGSMSPVKTSYPTDKYYLYYSGNEVVAEYKEKAKPAPRGHRALGKGLSGAAFYDPLNQSALNKGVKPQFHSEVQRLITDDSGGVVGVELLQLPESQQKKHFFWYQLSNNARMWMPPLAVLARKKFLAIEQQCHRNTLRIRAKKGVVISSGGFINNREMVKEYAPKYRKAMALGTAGCNGSGIRLGQSVGGAVDQMDSVSAWRFINPPQAWPQGIVVNGQGQRYVNEQVYGAKLGYHMCEEQEGKAILIINEALRKKTLKQILPPGKIWAFQMLPALLNIFFNAKKADTVAGLAAKCRLPVEQLTATIDRYNQAALGNNVDDFRKSDDFMADMSEGPYYAMDISVDSQVFPCPAITFGGLKVNEDSGAVIGESGNEVVGLYAAGRSAVGVASNLYVSGLSIADCVFSGRRAANTICKK